MTQKKSIILFSIVTNIRRGSFFERIFKMVFTMELTLGHDFEQKSQKRLLGYLGDQLTGGRGGKRPQSHIPRKKKSPGAFCSCQWNLSQAWRKRMNNVTCRAVLCCAELCRSVLCWVVLCRVVQSLQSCAALKRNCDNRLVSQTFRQWVYTSMDNFSFLDRNIKTHAG